MAAEQVTLSRDWSGVYRPNNNVAERTVTAASALVALVRAFGLVGLLALTVVCAATGWRVIEILRQIPLLQLRLALASVSVGDALLCALGWVVVRETLRARLRGGRP